MKPYAGSAMRVGARAVILGLGLAGLAVAAVVRFPGFPVTATQPVEQTTRQIENSPTPPREPQPQPKVSDSCIESASVSLSKELKLEKCRLNTTAWLNGRFILKQGSKEIWSFAYPQSTMASDSQAFMADLDSNGSPELVIANHNGTSNGLGIHYWTVYILPEPLTHPPPQPLQFAVAEYGKQGTFVRDGNQFELWTTEWSGGIIGQQWRYHSGQLIPTNHPILERWYSFNFERERAKTWGDPRIPYLWLATPKVRAHAEDPLLEAAEMISAVDGVVQSIKTECVKNDMSCIDKTKITFKPNQGTSRSYFYNRTGHQYGLEEEEAQSFAYFGDWSSRRIYPENYLPSNPNYWLHNRSCKLITYKRTVNDQSLFKILWLM